MTREERGVALALALVTLATYVNALGGTFHYDDFKVIVNNEHVHSWWAWAHHLPRGIRPILSLSYVAEWTMGLRAPGFLAFNVLVHVTTTLLLFVLGTQLAGEIPQRFRPWAAGVAAAVFALHPAQTEAVSYVSGRSCSLMALFYVGALLLAVIDGPLERSRRLVVSPLVYLLAIGAKETAVTLPAALVLWELSRGEAFSRALRRYAVHWLMTLVAVALLLASARYRRLLAFSAHLRSTPANVATEIHALSYLLSRTVLVSGLNIDPAVAVISRITARTVLEAVPVIGLAVAGLLQLRRAPWLGLGLLWCVLHVLPAHSIIARRDPTNDRQLYLAMWGLGLAAASIMTRGAAAFPKGVAAAVGLGVLAFFTVKRNAVYRSDVALWQNAALRSPGKSRVWNNLGFAYESEGRAQDAARAYTRAIELDPINLTARRNLARVR